ncbi:hypothetical protein ACFQL1_09085 [Halomicroarcula sp. GCM10025709]|uniref:hypothetical protein n=1 Tax=Haloarcula TaxID=2237 RepID=UPI0024C26C84|nr:hypothetical protein [Halomicroarcula sp. YJ-61-S]
MGSAERRNVNTTDPATVEDQADRVLVSFRSPETDPDEDEGWWVADSEWLQENMTERTYRRYLWWAHAGPVSVGDEWEEFVNCGCANPEDVILCVEAVDGGTAIGSETTIEVIPRKAVVEGDVEEIENDAS